MKFILPILFVGMALGAALENRGAKPIPTGKYWTVDKVYEMGTPIRREVK